MGDNFRPVQPLYGRKVPEKSVKLSQAATWLKFPDQDTFLQIPGDSQWAGCSSGDQALESGGAYIGPAWPVVLVHGEYYL